MKTNKVIISKDTEEQLTYFNWDVTELKQELPKEFPNSNSIEVTDCEISYIEVNVDGEYYVLNEMLEIIKNDRM